MRNVYIALGFVLFGISGRYASRTLATVQAPAAKNNVPVPSRAADVFAAENPLTIVCAHTGNTPGGECEQKPQLSAPSRVVIAFVPDPERTTLQLYFDRALEAIQWAAQDSGYNFYDYWLPWERPGAANSRPTDTKQELENRARRHREPGILAYRGSSAAGSLIVFLVGESPTGLFNVEQFSHALTYQRTIAAQQPDVLIVGPCFSGTLAGLGSAIRSQRIDHPFFTFRLLSGSASNPVAGQHFRDQWNDVGWGTQPKVTYSSFVYDDGTIAKSFITYVANVLHLHGKIAILSEGDTVFGAGFASDKVRSDTNITRIRFPRGISSVRNAYQEKTALKQAAAAATQASPATRQQLPLTLTDSENGADTLPEFAGQTPVSHETELTQIAELLQHDRVSLAVIVATDELDQIFLDRYIRTAAPDVRVVLFNGDVISSRSVDQVNLPGTLQFTTYPIFLASQGWLRPPEKRTQVAFSSLFEEGVYNAVSATLAQASDYAQKSDAQKGLPLFDYEQPFSDRPVGRPPLWVTITGRDGVWPLQLLNLPDRELTLDANGKPLIFTNSGTVQASGLQGLAPVAERPPRLWDLLMILGFAGSAVFLASFRRAQFSNRAWCADLRIADQRQWEAGRMFHIAVLILIGAILLLILLSGPMGFALALKPQGSPTTGLQVFTAVSGVVLLWLIWPALRLTHKIIITKGNRTNPYRLLSVFPWLVFAGFVICLWLILKSDHTFRGFFFAYRSQELGSGVSPSLPLLFLFLALGLWSFVHLQRVIFVQERYQFVPHLSTCRNCSPLSATVTELNRSFEKPFPAPLQAGLLIPFSVLLLVGAMGSRSMRSLEGVAYDALFITGTALLSALLAIAAVRFWLSWRLLLRILEQIEQHPIREAFSHLPPDYSWSPIWQHSPRKRNYVLASRLLESLRALKKMGVTYPEPKNSTATLESKLEELLAYPAEGKREPAELYRSVQCRTLAVAQAMVNKLNEGYWQRGNSETLKRIEGDGALKASKEQFEKDKPWLLLQEFVAMRFLAFIRYAMLQLRNLLTFITFGFVLMTLSLGSYPFQSTRVNAYFLGVFLLAIAIPVVWAFMEMGRDALLSRITDTRAGKLDWEFYMRTATFVALPLLAVLASHFPSIGQYVSSWVQPALKAVH